MYQHPLARRAPAPVTLTAIIVLAMLALCIALSGCALFAPPPSLSPKDQRSLQIASVEEQRTIVLKAINDLHDAGLIPTTDGGPIAQAADISKAATDAAKAANMVDDVAGFNAQLQIALAELAKLETARAAASQKKGGT